MTNSQIERDNRLIRYLLGEMSGEEQEKLEDAYFSDDALYEELEATETALIDAYVRGQISEDIRSRFEERYLASPRQREKVEFARLLFEKSLRPPSEEQEAIRWWQRILLPVSSPRRLLISAVALFALAIVIAGSLLLYRSGRPEPSLARRDQQAVPAGQRPAEVPSGAEESSKPVASAPAGDVIALSLVPGMTRGEAPGNLLRMPPSAKLVRLRLEYEGET